MVSALQVSAFSQSSIIVHSQQDMRLSYSIAQVFFAGLT